MFNRIFIAALFTTCTVLSSHATILPDPTGVWHLPSAPGTGVSVVQQGDTIFLAIFDYDEQLRPTWFVASNVKWNGIVADPSGLMPHVGDLYRTRGGWFGQPFDPAASGLERVGSVSIFQMGRAPDRNLSLVFTINGVNVTRTLKPLTFASEAPRFAGTFHTLTSTIGIPGSTCSSETGTKAIMTASVATNGIATLILGNLPRDVTCTAQGTFESVGNRSRFRGNMQCNGVPAGVMELDDIALTENGFLARVTVTGAVCTSVGTMSGLKALATM